MGLFKSAPIRIRTPTGRRPAYLRKARRKNGMGPAFYAFAVVSVTLGGIALVSDKDETLAAKVVALTGTVKN